LSSRPLPRAILFDLDDTLIRAYAQPAEAWTRLLTRFAVPLAAPDGAAIERLRAAVMEEARAFWSDSEAAARWRLDIPGARRLSLRRALARLGRPDEGLADQVADAFTDMRREEYRLYPDALATVDALRAAGVRLALITNGAAEPQRAKVERFDLVARFDHIQIEGEFGAGKPEHRVYVHALERLGVAPGEAWMVGDNPEWEVAAPQRLGMAGIFYDPDRQGLPAGATHIAPDRTIHRLADLIGG